MEFGNEEFRKHLEIIAEALLSYPIELKMQYRWNTDGSPIENPISREFNHGPASIDIVVILRVHANWHGNTYNWDLLNISRSFALTDKVFNKCCFDWNDNPITTCNDCD